VTGKEKPTVSQSNSSLWRIEQSQKASQNRGFPLAVKLGGPETTAIQTKTTGGGMIDDKKAAHGSVEAGQLTI
jgi:hypothetical protein